MFLFSVLHFLNMWLFLKLRTFYGLSLKKEERKIHPSMIILAAACRKHKHQNGAVQSALLLFV